MRARIPAVILLGLALMATPAHTQPSSLATLPAAMTGAQLQALVAGIIQDLQNAAATITGDAGIQVNGAAALLNTQMQQINNTLGTKVDQPLQSLGLQITTASTQIYNTATKLGDLISHQRQCLQLNEGLFIAGVRTVAAELKQGIPLVQSDAPYVSSFVFDQLSTSFVVPNEGGRFTTSGYALWTDNAPTVVLQSEDRTKVVANLTPGRAADNNSFSATLDPAVIVANIGSCLDLKITTNEDTHFLFIKTGVVHHELHIPMCVPTDYGTEWLLQASIYFAPEQEVDLGTVSPKTLYADNSSCEDRTNVAGLQLVWPEIGGDDHITNIDTHPGDMMRNQSSINVSVTGRNSVSAAGWLDTASCISVPFIGRKLDHSTVYQMVVTPHYAGKRAKSTESDLAVGPVPTQIPQTQVCAAVPKPVDTPTSVWWFVLQILTKKAPNSTPAFATSTLYSSGRMNVNDTIGVMSTAQVGGYSIDGTVNPTPVNGTAQICAKITVPDQCRY